MKNNIYRQFPKLFQLLMFGTLAQMIFCSALLANTENILKEVSPPTREVTVSGTITDGAGQPLPGATISVQGTTTGTVSDLDGKYIMTVPDNAVLVFSFVGFQSQSIPVGANSIINVTLVEDARSLNEVVVTALGISREKEALAYSVTEVKGEEFTKAREVNVANALIGKIAGVNITGMSSGPGGSSRVIIRGNGSLSGNNQPLYVING